MNRYPHSLAKRAGFRPRRFAGAPLRLRLSTLLALLLTWSVSHVGAQDTEGVSSEKAGAQTLDLLVEPAVDRAVQYILSQQREDGAITDRQYNTTMTSLSIMALASTGTTPSSPGSRGTAMRRALDFVLQDDRQDKNGYFGNRDGSRMYGHGVTTLMLTEMLGMGADDEQDQKIYTRCQRAIDLILSAQQQNKKSRFRGGWRYTPNSNDADLSVSVWQLMALRSAKNDGLEVPNDAIAEAIAYLNRSYASPLDAQGVPTGTKAGFCYLPENRNPSFAMTAAGLLAMQVCGQDDSPLAEGAADWLEEHPPKWNERFFFYGTYYYAQGMHGRGGEQAEMADELVTKLLLKHQKNNGSWSSPGGEEDSAGDVYATCMAVLSLSVRYHYLPIYQR